MIYCKHIWLRLEKLNKRESFNSIDFLGVDVKKEIISLQHYFTFQLQSIIRNMYVI